MKHFKMIDLSPKIREEIKARQEALVNEYGHGSINAQQYEKRVRRLEKSTLIYILSFIFVLAGGSVLGSGLKRAQHLPHWVKSLRLDK